VRVGIAPGSEWRYSGGGYTLLQLIIEEVTGEAFNTYMQRAVLQPLGMQHSTFDLPNERSAEVAEFFAPDGTPATHYRFTAKAAASLYTSSADLARFIQAHMPGSNGERPGRGVLRPTTLTAMRQPHAARYGFDIWGLGVILYAPNNSTRNDREPNGFIIGHDGDNYPAINTAARFDPATGDGIVVLATGNKLLATELAGEWVFWQSGNVDVLDGLSAAPRALIILGAGYLTILIGGVLAARRLLRGRSTQAAH
jgi:CubicO group peptidase (beta-lactamase class C family)